MVYVHVPFCHRKCTYCAFYSTASKRWEGEYVERLLEEMERRCVEQRGAVRTVYVGGGTPTILPVEQLARVVEGLQRNFDLSRVEEVTIEANPEDLTPEYVSDLVALGFFNRVSIGVQSLDDEQLHLIGRRHSAEQALEAIERVNAAGIRNIGVDIIYGLPGRFRLPELDFRKVSHVSAYALTVEPDTALAVQVEQGRMELPDEEEVVRQYHALVRRLSEEGLRQYEISNFAREGFESRHNSRYWNRTPYVGIGPSAHSFDGKRRSWNGPMNGEDGGWREGGSELLSENDSFNELLMTSLRTVRGLELAKVPEQYREALLRKVASYVERGWLVLADHPGGGTAVEPTTEGLLHADGMAAALFV